MKYFNLPDLGEGLTEAEISKWYIAEGDNINADQPMVSLETAKAIVDIPSPYSGKIKKIFGKPGETIKTGTPLVSFEETQTKDTSQHTDNATVVGSLEAHDTIIHESPTGISKSQGSKSNKVKAVPAVRMLARQLNVQIDKIKPANKNGIITANDVKKAANIEHDFSMKAKPSASTKTCATNLAGEENTLKSIRRTMAINIDQAHREVAPVTVFDVADINAWNTHQDITLRLIRAIITGCQEEPALNAHFDSKSCSQKLFNTINLGLALDTPQGLYVPVLKDIAMLNDSTLRSQIENFKSLAASQSFTPDLLSDATFILSNFGSIAGRYATPMVIPPMVAIIGIGKIYDGVVVSENKQPVIHRLLPISLTFDHRAVTGGEAARFLHATIKSLELRDSTHNREQKDVAKD